MAINEVKKMIDEIMDKLYQLEQFYGGDMSMADNYELQLWLEEVPMGRYRYFLRLKELGTIFTGKPYVA